MTLLMVIAVLIGACGKDEDDTTLEDDNNNNNQTVENKNNYLASGSYGDVITYQIDEDNNTYSYINETTGESDSGTYTSSSVQNLNGVYEISIASDKFYAVELDDKIICDSAEPKSKEEVRREGFRGIRGVKKRPKYKRDVIRVLQGYEILVIEGEIPNKKATVFFQNFGQKQLRWHIQKLYRHFIPMLPL